MANTPVNATGWAELMDGKMVNAVYRMFDASLGGIGLFVLFMFILYQFILFQKTGNVTLMWVTGVFFVAMMATTQFIPSMTLNILFTILLLEFAAIFYLTFFG